MMVAIPRGRPRRLGMSGHSSMLQRLIDKVRALISRVCIRIHADNRPDIILLDSFDCACTVTLLDPEAVIL
jgi:hypothetical protein